jgi:hypothetical protein
VPADELDYLLFQTIGHLSRPQMKTGLTHRQARWSSNLLTGS